MECDALVLGAGMAGVSAALHLQQRGRAVVLIDRCGAAEETSYGNTGLIQSEGIVPYAFPRDIGKIVQYALNRLPESHLHWRALPRLARPLFQYWRNAAPERVAAAARAFEPLARRCIVEHEAFMQAAGVMNLLRRTGYLKLYPTSETLQTAVHEEEQAKAAYGVDFRTLSESEARGLEPHLRGTFAGAIHLPDPVSVSDPGAVGKAYAELFVARGGTFRHGEARTLEETAAGWRVQTDGGPVAARDAIVALGAWSNDVLQPLGYRFPLFVKRGYHMHYAAAGNAVLNRPVVDQAGGYVLASMTKGIRLTTGAEFADRDAPATPVQLAKVEPMARALFPLGDRVEPQAWMGRRPCLPDMLPIVGRAPRHRGLWLDFGHHHWGFTLGPVSGRLLADLVTGETPFVDPAPYGADRFS
ncbi:MAG: NAD(P)/FAD-dependent oxidoreductase [Hyphomicrobiaceae bacterium]